MSSTPDITLYSAPTPNGIKASIVLEELGVPYKAESIDIMQNTQKEPWFLEINPNGKIPAIRDGQNRIFESVAIMLYLVDKYDAEHKISHAHGTPEYYEQLGWLMFHTGGVGPTLGQANHFYIMAKVRSDYANERFLTETKRLFSVLDATLSKQPYLTGSKYTIADIANYCWVKDVPDFLDMDLGEWPAVKKWCEEIDKREAVQRGSVVPEAKWTKEQLLGMFAGMKAKLKGMKNADLS